MFIVSRFIVLLAAMVLVTLPAAAQSGSWVGRYEFSEDGGKTAGGSPIFIEHEVEVAEGDDGLVAFLKSNGYQTSVDIIATAKINGTRLEIYFEGYGEDNLFERFESGDLLLSLERKTVRGREVLLTHWGKFEPALEKNEVSGRTHFAKVKNEELR